MLVCHCHRVSHREIQEAVRAGAETLAEVGARCGAGTSCRGCVNAVCELINDTLIDAESLSCPHPPVHPLRVAAP